MISRSVLAVRYKRRTRYGGSRSRQRSRPSMQGPKKSLMQDPGGCSGSDQTRSCPYQERCACRSGSRSFGCAASRLGSPPLPGYPDERVVGATSELSIEPLKHHEPLMLSVGTAVTVGVVTSAKKDLAEVTLKRPVCAEPGARIAISRQLGARWRLIGMGVLIE